MKIEERLEILKKVESIAALAGLRGVVTDDGDCFRMGFETTNGRSQGVFVRPSGHTPDGKVIVTLFSPANTFPKGLFKGLGKEAAMELLRLNEKTFFARFGLWESKSEVMVVASIDAILESLDADEIRAYSYYAANAADEYESRHGRDRF
ncbi:MAG: hypothetical protein ACKO50_14550 [Cyanobium sp.]